MLSIILIILLVFIVLGTLPIYPHSRAWGPYPSGLLGIILVVVLIVVLSGRW